MQNCPKQAVTLILIASAFFGASARASNLDTIGVTLLRAETTNVDGLGVRVAQPEAYDFGTTNWEVNPASSPVQQPENLFTYTSNLGSTTNYPNT